MDTAIMDMDIMDTMEREKLSQDITIMDMVMVMDMDIVMAMAIMDKKFKIFAGVEGIHYHGKIC